MNPKYKVSPHYNMRMFGKSSWGYTIKKRFFLFWYKQVWEFDGFTYVLPFSHDIRKMESLCEEYIKFGNKTYRNKR